MNDLIDNLQLINEIERFNVIEFSIALTLAIITSFVLKFTYEEKSKSLSSKKQMSSILPLLTIVTFLVIMIVKSSLALSLGLVGALSIVRFRTPIKEPEDLIYLFLAIGIGIGYGALQILITSLVFVVIIFIIWIILKKENITTIENYNFIISFPSNELYKKYNKISLNDIKSLCKEINLIKIEKNEDGSIVLYLSVNFENFEKMQSLTALYTEKYKEINFSIYEDKTLY